MTASYRSPCWGFGHSGGQIIPIGTDGGLALLLPGSPGQMGGQSHAAAVFCLYFAPALTNSTNDKPNSHSVSLVPASLKPRPRHSFQAVVGWRARGLRAPAQPRRLSAWPACNHEVVPHSPSSARRAREPNPRQARAETSGSGGRHFRGRHFRFWWPAEEACQEAKKPVAKKKVASGSDSGHRQWPLATLAGGSANR